MKTKSLCIENHQRKLSHYDTENHQRKLCHYDVSFPKFMHKGQYQVLFLKDHTITYLWALTTTQLISKSI